MLPVKRTYPVVFSMILMVVTCDEIGNVFKNINVIRFYDRQYFQGNYWTLDSQGKWSSSQRSRMNVPYRHFHPRSIRAFCSNPCRWKICPMKRRQGTNLQKKNGCKIMTNGNQLETMRPWGWSNDILGYAKKMPNKIRKVKKVKKEENGTVVVVPFTTTSYTSSVPTTMLFNNGKNRGSTTTNPDSDYNTITTTQNTFLKFPGAWNRYIISIFFTNIEKHFYN